ncbi:MAG: aminotransferase class I/II-fold pyridoxal phosphate-dependent enzyme [Candidatus Eisenbacteria bacterium]
MNDHRKEPRMDDREPAKHDWHPYGTPQLLDGHAGPLAPDLTRSTTFALPDAATVRDVGAETIPGEFYPRYGHPAGRLFEARVAALEGGDGAVSFGSGMAAFHAVFCSLLSSGDTLLCSRDVYGGITGLVERDLPRFGIRVRRFDPFDLSTLAAAWDPSVRLVHLETPTNPLARVVDLDRVAALVREKSGRTDGEAARRGASRSTEGAASRASAGGEQPVLLSVDATFAPPPLQQVLRHGVDLAVHSATKFLGGHHDAIAGVVTGRHSVLQVIEKFRRRTGGILGPDTAWLLHRSLATLELRVRRQSATAEDLARRLESMRQSGAPIAKVHYPGLPEHPDHDVAKKQMDGFGAMLGFEVAGGLDGATRVYDRFRVIARAVSLGGVDTLSSLPLHTSHAMTTAEQRAEAGIADGLVRLSIGLEPVDVLAADLEHALAAAGK